VGYGTDTEFRMQYRWDRHLMSPRGDSFNAGLGWQAQDEQLLLFGEYRLPRRTDTPQYWSVSSLLKKETETLRITDNAGEVISLARGRVDNGSVRFSRVRFRPVENGRERIAESIYIEHLSETNDLAERSPEGGPVTLPDGDVTDLLQQTSRSLSLGIDWDWPVIKGRGFHTSGHHEHAWLFSANQAWGSELDFTQAYVSSRWNFLLGERWKLLVRGEAGYTEADLVEVEVVFDGVPREFAVTQLPHRYRFLAGGSSSVRGYSYEELSSNGVGSNNLLTGSVEMEDLIHGVWSAAVFVDAGNAFNDWSEVDIRTGAGVGVRWYTVAGALRLDVARGLDKPGQPWEIYITIGTPLL
jgi:translocation and assembly module TamA